MHSAQNSVREAEESLERERGGASQYRVLDGREGCERVHKERGIREAGCGFAGESAGAVQEGVGGCGIGGR